jgi:hypothetical protein
VNIATPGRDTSIKVEHIETAMASFSKFCGDPSATMLIEASCKADLAGFLTFVNMRDWSATDSSTMFASNGFKNTIDEICFQIGVANASNIDVTPYATLLSGKNLETCRAWTNKTTPNSFSQYPENAKAMYFARGCGPIELKGASNYGKFSFLFLGDESILLTQPEYAEDPRILTSIAMYSYMGYGINGSNAPSIHDMFTGYWTPNAAETTAGYSSTTIVNSMMGVVAHVVGNNQSCASYIGPATIASGKNFGDVYFVLAKILGVSFDANQDIRCTNVKAYPNADGPNKNFWLAFNSTTSKCDMTTTVTEYHAFRSGDLRKCIAFGKNNGNYVAARTATKVTSTPYTDFKLNYPYKIGSHAAVPGDSTNTAMKCLKAVECAYTPITSSLATAVWGTKDVAATLAYFNVALITDPDTVECLSYDGIKLAGLSATTLELTGANAKYVCHNAIGKPLRVFKCIDTTANCLAVEPTDANAAKWEAQ